MDGCGSVWEGVIEKEGKLVSVCLCLCVCGVERVPLNVQKFGKKLSIRDSVRVCMCVCFLSVCV